MMSMLILLSISGKSLYSTLNLNLTNIFSVFGESILNDGVAVVLFQVFESFIKIGRGGTGAINGTNIYRAFLKFSIVAGGGTLVGLVLGFLSSFLFKSQYTVISVDSIGLKYSVTYTYPIVEPLFIYTISYVAYLISELLDLSAILGTVQILEAQSIILSHHYNK